MAAFHGGRVNRGKGEHFAVSTAYRSWACILSDKMAGHVWAGMAEWIDRSRNFASNLISNVNISNFPNFAKGSIQSDEISGASVQTNRIVSRYTDRPIVISVTFPFHSVQFEGNTTLLCRLITRFSHTNTFQTSLA